MSDDRPVRVWTRYVAIGDSFTEGLVDEDPDAPGVFVGWADRLAEHLDAVAASAGKPFAYANLAIRGRLLADVVGPQLDAALAQGPDLVSIVGGGNDILRPSVDLTEVADRLEAAVVQARAAGADVLLATPTDPRDAGLLSALRTRQAVHT
ncbi:MAG TPA: SGNH/GDSL hydrolase family protein, partial [Dermatophilaceae bacterium]|nr:SGNH/GDSL hydrolase family protein [Dermatophilaceae bacterium]